MDTFNVKESDNRWKYMDELLSMKKCQGGVVVVTRQGSAYILKVDVKDTESGVKVRFKHDCTLRLGGSDHITGLACDKRGNQILFRREVR